MWSFTMDAERHEICFFLHYGNWSSVFDPYYGLDHGVLGKAGSILFLNHHNVPPSLSAAQFGFLEQ